MYGSTNTDDDGLLLRYQGAVNNVIAEASHRVIPHIERTSWAMGGSMRILGLRELLRSVLCLSGWWCGAVHATVDNAQSACGDDGA